VTLALVNFRLRSSRLASVALMSRTTRNLPMAISAHVCRCRSDMSLQALLLLLDHKSRASSLVTESRWRSASLAANVASAGKGDIICARKCASEVVPRAFLTSKAPYRTGSTTLLRGVTSKYD